MKVVIFGASKGIGLETVRRALEAGYQVRAFARSASAIPDTHPNLEKVDGDALDPEAVRAAIGPGDVVIQALGVSLTPQNVISPVTLFSNATRVLVDAMKEVGATRLICVTGFGAGDSAGRGGFFYQAFGRQGLLKRAYDDKDIQEWIIRRSGLDWTIVRPGILTDGPHTGRYQVLNDPREWRVGKISRANVADFLVKQVESDAHICDTPVLIE
ncbi:NAD(P)-dependent oxidoreductase [Dichotomicrobium thermohalophilum]|uniref:Putative NADH-flavin reductase n=1 Tax=Dichotomicrobium thermohalophilum TaxID=933063 RepID=A0A397QAM6_9HYPH|nr:SDR family oxidoreductase [Dichotomicrobium thermohalophilum]RIA55271.1 putative NADH-flavin reductase [Dichotomicrobium thermohalophilum]